MDKMIRCEQFDVSISRGFISDREPLTRLPPYFKPWEDLADNLSLLIENKTLRQMIDQMPLLDHTKLNGTEELKQATIVLSYLSHGYVWMNGDVDVVKVLPKCLAVPWTAVTESLGLPPVLTHFACVLQNWELRDKNRPIELGNVDTQFTFLGGEDAQHEKVFFLYTLLIEKQASKGIQAALNGQKAVLDESVQSLAEALAILEESINDMINVLLLMSEHLDVGVFYTKLRPFLSGWENNAALPDGLVYAGVSSEPKKFSGGSAAESSIVPTFDAALGIEHLSQKDGKSSFLQKMRRYMPLPHRQFIDAVANGPSIRKFVEDIEDLTLTATYNSCVKALLNFRSIHIKVVAKYVTIPASKGCNTNVKSLAKTGTGGTGVMPFLKALRDETRDAISLS